MFNELIKYAKKPEFYAQGTDVLWDDEHISKGMLEAHLNPNLDAASRNHKFIDDSVAWITQISPSSKYIKLLDLGCGPGLYAERFNEMGYDVTGIDFSKRSIDYAKQQSALNNSKIDYIYQNYLTLDYAEQFDVITLIYTDYCVLSKADRLALLRLVYQALKPNGKFIFDVSTSSKNARESRSWSYHENGGFFSDKPHIHLSALYLYKDENETELAQHIVISSESVKTYNVWHNFFTKEKLLAEIQPLGFSDFELYGDVTGKEYVDNGEIICLVLTK
jgi:SAM-dependent methyltransferase